jgi:hypothetical protein
MSSSNALTGALVNGWVGFEISFQMKNSTTKRQRIALRVSRLAIIVGNNIEWMLYVCKMYK